MAMTPLEQLQPSIAALANAYFGNFPEILECRPQFLKRVVQFSGLALIIQIQAMLQHQSSFDNTGICMLQVAKGLLCRPEQSIPILSRLMPEVAQAISEVKEGEVIGPIETKIGYHIIKIEKWFPTELSESVREEISESLFQAWLREQSSSH